MSIVNINTDSSCFKGRFRDRVYGCWNLIRGIADTGEFALLLLKVFSLYFFLSILWSLHIKKLIYIFIQNIDIACTFVKFIDTCHILHLHSETCMSNLRVTCGFLDFKSWSYKLKMSVSIDDQIISIFFNLILIIILQSHKLLN